VPRDAFMLLLMPAAPWRSFRLRWSTSSAPRRPRRHGVHGDGLAAPGARRREPRLHRRDERGPGAHGRCDPAGVVGLGLAALYRPERVPSVTGAGRLRGYPNDASTTRSVRIASTGRRGCTSARSRFDTRRRERNSTHVAWKRSAGCLTASRHRVPCSRS